MKRRILAAILSTVTFSLLYALLFYTPESKQLANHWYEPLSSFLIVPAIFTLPAYVLAGIPISIYIDQRETKPFVKVLLYLLAGFTVGIITILISFRTVSFELFYFGLYGLLASLIFYLLLKLIGGKKAQDY